MGWGNWLAQQLATGRLWSLNSVGPDLVDNMDKDAASVYDPSNGSISTGDIYRLGP